MSGTVESGRRVIAWDGHKYRLRHRRVVAVFNQKGGVGKTVTAVQVSAEMADRGVDVLLCDLDQQANTTTGYGVDPAAAAATMYEVLHPTPDQRVSIDEATVQVRPNLRLVPSHKALASIEEYGNGPGGELLLRRALRQAKPADVTIFDCPPNLGRISIAALAAAEEVQLLVPVKCGPDELAGLAALMDSIEKVKANGLAAPELAYVVATMYDGRRKLDRGVDNYLARQFGDAYVRPPIRQAVRMPEAKASNLPLREYDPSARAVADYANLARTIVKRGLSA